ncbi:acryloyl-CoA reductase [candidate division KSB1 bacterium]|nr:acryloyl-CoA reductase [candidate division KSB1 bacterium]
MNSYKAYLAIRNDDNSTTTALTTRNMDELPPGDVLIRVAYSSLNYKDALSATGAPGVTKNYPHVPGIDASGEVVESAVAAYNPGDEVLVTGYDLGSNTDGGYAEYIRVPAEWVVPLPAGLTAKDAMIYGTAGFTAALCVHSLQRNNLKPDMGPVVVTGATGGVGSVAIGILAKLGYTVIASTGKSSKHDFIKKLGASSIVDRDAVQEDSGRPLLKSRWAGAVDTVGGNTLTTIVKSIQQQGSVAACGVVAGPKLELTVFPFILRGVRLLGIDSAMCPHDLRRDIWAKLADEWKPAHLESLVTTIHLKDLDSAVASILKGQNVGRTVVKISNET